MSLDDEELKNGVSDVSETVEETVEDVAETAEDAVEEVTETTEDAVEYAEESADDAEEKAQELFDSFSESDGENVPEVAPKKSSKGPIIAIALIFIAIIVGVVIWLVKNDKDKAGKTVSLTSDDYYKNFTYDAYSVEPATNSDAEAYYTETVATYADMYSQMGYSFYEEDPDRAADKVAEGDTVSVSYTGYIDGAEFDGGTGTNDQLTIGSNSFIDGFETGLIGLGVGEMATLNLTFPEDYSNTEYAGKAVTFDVTINYFCKAVELTEENAYKLLFGYENMDDCIASIITYLDANPEMTEEQYMINVKTEYIDYVIEGATFEASVDTDVQERYEKVLGMYETYVTNYGTELTTIAQQMGYADEAAFKEDILTVCEQQVKAEIVFAEIAAKEKITISDEDYHTYAFDYATSAGYNETDEAGVTDENATIAAYQTDYDKNYGEGKLELYLKTMYYEDTLFDKYATVNQ